jgi:rubredoxin
MKKYECKECGYIYEEVLGDPDGGVKPETEWKDVPHDWVCPVCKESKSEFTQLKQ